MNNIYHSKRSYGARPGESSALMFRVDVFLLEPRSIEQLVDGSNQA